MKSAIILIFTGILLAVAATGKAQNSLVDEVSAPMLDTLIKLARINYPRMKAFEKRIAIAKSNLDKTRLSWFDGLGLYYLYLPPNNVGSLANPTTNRNGFQLGFSLNVGSLLEKPAQIRGARIERQVASLERDEFDLSIMADVKERYYRYIQQVSLLKQKTQMSLDAQAMLLSVKSKFEKGTETFTTYNTSLVFYSQQKEEQVNTEADLLISKARLEELIGVNVDSIILEQGVK